MNEVVFPRGADGRRSSSEFGRAVVTDALRVSDPAAAAAAERERDWRKGYLTHFRALVGAGLRDGHDVAASATERDTADGTRLGDRHDMAAGDGRDLAAGDGRETADDARVGDSHDTTDSARLGYGYDIAAAGLESVHRRMRVSREGDEIALDDVFAVEAKPPASFTIAGDGKPERELLIPYGKQVLRGDSLHRQLDAWVSDGVIEESCAEMVREVAANPDWLDISDHRLVVLGAGAELGPLPAVLAWGGTVVGVDLPRPQVWERIIATARRGAES